MTDTTVTIRVSGELKQRLENLGTATRRSKSFLANEATARYVETEEQYIEGTMRALEQMRFGEGIPHETMMREIDTLITAAEQRSVHW